MRTVQVKVENTYVCGRETEFIREIPAPAGIDAAALEEWWEDEAHGATGDGHQAGEGGPDCIGGEREDALYEVTVLASPYLHMVGEKREWGL